MPSIFSHVSSSLALKGVSDTVIVVGCITVSLLWSPPAACSSCPSAAVNQARHTGAGRIISALQEVGNKFK